jgi:hypothetical protein
MSIQHGNVPQLNWGSLHIGIREEGSTQSLHGPRHVQI